jgi:predicted nuclease of predicted toxin-antitoxin system
VWLVDENLPPKLYRALEEFGISAKSATYAGLGGITNGVLTRKAFEMGFRVIITQDKTFVQDAAVALKQHPTFCVVVLVLDQTPAKTFLERFKEEWSNNPIVPKEGDVVMWPSIL